MSSPENADNEDTPDQTPKSAKRNSLFGMYGRFAPSPGRGEIPRMSHYSNAMARRVHKRRRRDKALGRQIQVDSDDESDRPSSHEEEQPADRNQNQKPSRMSSFSDFFSLLEEHPNVPGILSWWAQLVVNLSLFSLAVYVVFGFVSAIRTEFDHAAEEASDSILAEMATCAKSYVDNKCAGGGRLPALETVCENWERCMNRDPAKIGRAKVSAHTMAIIINSFIDPISWKAIVRPFVLLVDRANVLAILPRHHVHRHRGQQLVVPHLQEPFEPARVLAPTAEFPAQPAADARASTRVLPGAGATRQRRQGGRTAVAGAAADGLCDWTEPLAGAAPSHAEPGQTGATVFLIF